MKNIFPYLLLCLAIFFSFIMVIEFYQVDGSIVINKIILSTEFSFSGIKMGNITSVFSLRIISYISLLITAIITRVNGKSLRKDLFFMVAVYGIYAEVFNLLNMFIFHFRFTTIFHLDVLFLIVLIVKLLSIPSEDYSQKSDAIL